MYTVFGLAEPSEIPESVVNQKDLGAAEISLWLRAQNVLPQDLGSFLSAQMAAKICNSSYRVPDNLTQTYMQVNAHNIKIDKSFSKTSKGFNF